MRTVLLVAAALALACSGGGKGDPLDAVTTSQTIGGVQQISARVSVVFDGLGVPHIYAASDADAAFALGYVQARDRFFEMDLLRKLARGRSGELFGRLVPAVRDQDILLRTMFTSTKTSSTGSHHVEDLIAEQLGPDLRPIAEHYRDGVNLWLSDAQAGRNKATLHPQYQALGMSAAEIAPWTVEDSAAIGRLQSFQLSDTSAQELAAASLVAAGLPQDVSLDVARHAQAVPSVILDGAASAPRGSGLRAAPLMHAPKVNAALAAARASIEGALAARLAVRLPFGDHAGSNNWTVAPRLTAGGHALLANDPHLSLSNPPNLHMIHLVTPTRNVAGVAFPGAPVIVIGHNDRIAWGDTVVGYDVTDLYVEQLDRAATPPTVVFKNAPVPVEVLTETRKVRGSSDDSYAILLVPHRGPILPQSLTGSVAMSVRWTGQDPTFELEAFFDLEAARSVDEAFDAVRSFGVGAQNFVFADTQGHIGYFPRALVPIRGTGPASGCLPWLPMDGTTDACDWTGFVADADLPQAKDPSAGFLATANNDVTGVLVPPGPGQDANPLAAPRYLYAYSDIGFREQRIRNRLQATSQHTLDGMTSIQADDHSELAETMMPGILALLQGQALSPAAQAAVTVWSTWDFSTPRGDETGVPEIAQHSAASAAFHAFIGSFARSVLGPRLLPAVPLQALPSEQSLKIAVALAQGAASPASYPLVAPATTWCGGGCAPVAAAALEDAVARLASRLPGVQPGAWRWGDLHHVLFRNPLRPLLSDFPPSGPGFPNDGGLFTVDVANFDLFDGNGQPSNAFEQHDGPNVRMATELDPAGVRSRMVIPGGEVDRPSVLGSEVDPHYMDQVPAWLANQPGDQPFAQPDVIKAAAAKIVFTR